MTFGGYNESQLSGPLHSVKLSTTLYWAINLKAVYFGDQRMSLDKTNMVIADTGTSFMLIPDYLFKVLRKKWLKNLGSDDKFICAEFGSV